MTGTVRPEYRMLPEISKDTEPFWTGGAEGELRIHRCRACECWFHPPAGVCFRCRSRDVGPQAVSGRAKVAAYTINQHTWFPGFPPPYIVALVELDEEPDVRLTTNIVDCAVADVRVGMPVQVTFDRHEDVWVPIFRPVAS